MRLENTKSRDEKRIGGVIHNWYIDDVTFPDNPVVRGLLIGDSYWGNEIIRTSVIVSINEDETELETLNTIYQLRDKREITE